MKISLMTNAHTNVNGGELGGRNTDVNNDGSGNEDKMFEVKFFCQNVRGLNKKEKRKTIFDYAKSKASVIFLQETHSVPLIEQSWGMSGEEK